MTVIYSDEDATKLLLQVLMSSQHLDNELARILGETIRFLHPQQCARLHAQLAYAKLEEGTPWHRVREELRRAI